MENSEARQSRWLHVWRPWTNGLSCAVPGRLSHAVFDWHSPLKDTCVNSTIKAKLKCYLETLPWELNYSLYMHAYIPVLFVQSRLSLRCTRNMSWKWCFVATPWLRTSWCWNLRKFLFCLGRMWLCLVWTVFFSTRMKRDNATKLNKVTAARTEHVQSQDVSISLYSGAIQNLLLSRELLVSMRLKMTLIKFADKHFWPPL